MKNNVISLNEIREERLNKQKDEELYSIYEELARMLILESDVQGRLKDIFKSLEGTAFYEEDESNASP